MPPTPTSVNRRLPGNSRLISTNSRSRPMNDVSGSGRFERLRPLRASWRVVRELGDRSDEAIAAPCQRLDPALAAGRLREHAANRRDLHREIAFFDDDARPRGVDDAVLRNVLVRSLDERGQDGHRARAQGHGLASLGQHACLGVEPERPDVIDPGHATSGADEATDRSIAAKISAASIPAGPCARPDQFNFYRFLRSFSRLRRRGDRRFAP